MPIYCEQQKILAIIHLLYFLVLLTLEGYLNDDFETRIDNASSSQQVDEN